MSNKQNSEQGSVGRKVAIGIAVLIVIVAIIAGIFANNKKNSDGNTGTGSNTSAAKEARAAADKFLSGVDKSDVDGTWNMMDDRYRNLASSKDGWSTILSVNSTKNITSPTYVKTVADTANKDPYKDKQLHYVTYNYKIDGAAKTEILFVIKDNGTWKIDGMDVQ